MWKWCGRSRKSGRRSEGKRWRERGEVEEEVLCTQRRLTLSRLASHRIHCKHRRCGLGEEEVGGKGRGGAVGGAMKSSTV